MGPRHLSRGKQSLGARIHPLHPASMGPRHWSRGRHRSIIEAEDATDASMEPRHRSRGRQRLLAVNTEVLVASMGPWHWSRGRLKGNNYPLFVQVPFEITRDRTMNLPTEGGLPVANGQNTTLS
jgi:hypothetical protein